ncbi:hypothetical protein E2562_033654 [Oryza meyeriana var. granulata]|uniref:Uncharacterized protein n=1 Tax=Oryza meyeriana var. granulata TaxID=110450 RepID=A0A6G1CBU1_9ORYZ|nr:hypothetical protein E2562_033654 [Oryza meyeriana var. granulata]
MAEHVQPFTTLRIDTLWVDVPIGSLQAANSGSSLRTTAASPTLADDEQEVSSVWQDGFIPVLSKAARRRRRAAARAREASSQEHVINVREAASSDSVPPGFTRAAPVKTRSFEPSPRFRHTTLGEWHVREIRMNPSKEVPHNSVTRLPVTPTKGGVATPTTKNNALGANSSLVCEAGSSSTPVAVPLNIAPEILRVMSPKISLSILVAAPSKSTVATLPSTGGVLNCTHRLRPLDKGKVVMVDETHHELPSNIEKDAVVPQSTMVPHEGPSNVPSQL